MSPVLISGVLIAFFVFMVSPSKGQDESWLFRKKLDIPIIRMQEPSLLQKEVEYDAIYSYIQNNFRNISRQDAEDISTLVVTHALAYDLDPKLLAALIAQESRFKKNAISVTGAKGLGQIKDFNFKILQIQDPFDINQNIKGTAQYLKSMMTSWEEKFSKLTTEKNEKLLEENEKKTLSLALASYFKGYTGVHKDKGIFDTATKKYVANIWRHYDAIKAMKPKKPPLMIENVIDAELEPGIPEPSL